MYLTLIRHGEAHPAFDGVDETRQLTTLGHEQAERTAVDMKPRIQPDVFVVSPLTRAQQTLAHLQSYFPDVPVIICEHIKPDDDAKFALDKLQQIEIEGHYQNMVVVCHMNIIAYMDQLLTANTIQPFNLAEGRMYQLSTISQGLATVEHQFVP